jgi:20S proteasome subunit beta 6
MAAPPAPIWNTEDSSMAMNMNGVEVDGSVKTTPFERRFNPYDFNGGTNVVIAGEDYAIAAGCTRMSTGFEIMSRDQTKLFNLTDKTVLTSAGCMSDVVTLRRMLDARLTQYKHATNCDMSTQSAAQLLGNTLYGRRFFPYYAFCLMAGLDEEGKGAVYGYDAVGSFKRDDYGAMGSGQKFVMPILDHLIGHKHRQDEKKALSLDEAISIVKDCFIIATERDIHTGDALEIKIITKDGTRTERMELKKD